MNKLAKNAFLLEKSLISRIRLLILLLWLIINYYNYIFNIRFYILWIVEKFQKPSIFVKLKTKNFKLRKNKKLNAKSMISTLANLKTLTSDSGSVMLKTSDKKLKKKTIVILCSTLKILYLLYSLLKKIRSKTRRNILEILYFRVHCACKKIDVLIFQID